MGCWRKRKKVIEWGEGGRNCEGSSRKQRQDSALTLTEPLQGSRLRSTEFDPSSNGITLAAAPRMEARGPREEQETHEEAATLIQWQWTW